MKTPYILAPIIDKLCQERPQLSLPSAHVMPLDDLPLHATSDMSNTALSGNTRLRGQLCGTRVTHRGAGNLAQW